MNQLRFRTRLVLILSLFAIVPALLLTLLWSGTVSTALPFVGERAAWDSVTATGKRAITLARNARLTAAQTAALDAHERELRSSAEQSRRYSYLATRAIRLVAIGGLLALLILTGAASRVAGHLSRQLSRPLDEIIHWTELIAHGESLPPPRASPAADASGLTMPVTSRVRGAPEFEQLRQSMRGMAAEIEEGRRAAVESERLHAFRETARRVAHELKNTLTPIRFALAKLKQEAPAQLADTINVLETESLRLEQMAASFAQFGRMPEGPSSEIDLGELARYAAQSIVREPMKLDLRIADQLPLVRGNHAAISGALSNLLLNAVDASPVDAVVRVQVRRSESEGSPGVRVSVADQGKGIPAGELAGIWEPYFTTKEHGTGLGLAIAKQAILANGGTVEAKSALGEGTEIAFTLPSDPATTRS